MDEELPATPQSATVTGGSSERFTVRAVTVAVMVIALWSLATVVANRYRSQKTQRASHAAVVGRSELTGGHAEEAARHFRNAVALEPDTIQYRLDLAGALLALRQVDEATNYLRDVLRRDPVNGAANLSIARIHDRLGDVEEAETAFYRAIYGRWPTGEDDARRHARLELIDFLSRTADANRVRAELVQIAAAFPGDLPLQLQAGRSLLDMGFPQQAADVLGAAADRFTDPGAAFAMLAQAKLLLGDYNGALDATSQALRLDPTDVDSAVRRDIATAALGMDPTQTRLSVRVRASRLQALLKRVLPLLVACHGDTPADMSHPQMTRDIQAWLESPRSEQVEHTDAGLGLLEAAARDLMASCPTAPGDDQALQLLLGRLSGIPST